LADDHAIAVESLRAVIEPHYEIVGTATDGRALIKAAQLLRPDLILLDVRMPSLCGIDATIEIKATMPEIKVVFVTMHTNSTYVKAALEAGASGYVLKSAVPEVLLEAVRLVLDDRIYVSPGLSTERLSRSRQPARSTASRLSLREQETLRLVGEGRSVAEIAHDMNISVKTVAFHRMNIRKKLRLKSASELAKHAAEALSKGSI
jgi:DNA-binding NarL/FixJ family response regulator